jgi:peptidoglycan hydrolase-like protein with peptidoglycan-binding domain
MGPDAGDKGMAVTSEDIKKAQDALKAKGLNPGTGGKLDPQTQQALREFQKANNLPATGVLDEKTAAKLGVTMGTQGKSLPGESTSPKPSDPLR